VLASDVEAMRAYGLEKISAVLFDAAVINSFQTYDYARTSHGVSTTINKKTGKVRKSVEDS
jgi:hypothetical protein